MTHHDTNVRPRRRSEPAPHPAPPAQAQRLATRAPGESSLLASPVPVALPSIWPPSTTSDSLRPSPPQRHSPKTPPCHTSTTGTSHLSHSSPLVSSFNSMITEMIAYTICVIALGLVVAFLSFCVPVFRRGFFCDDESIRYPLVASATVSTFTLVVVTFLAPLSVFAAVDGLRLIDLSTSRDSWQSVTSSLLRSLYEVFGVFVFGAGLNQVTVDVGKYTVGRLRPHFLDACRPLNDVCSLADPGQYITDYQCSGDSRTVEEARLSFPSGHAALSFYAAVYVSVFLQQRLYWRGARLARHLAQGSFVIVAWFTALSRVQDYMHHPTDVLAGIAVGTVWALVMTRYVIDMRLDDQHATKEELRSLRSTPVHMQGANSV